MTTPPHGTAFEETDTAQSGTIGHSTIGDTHFSVSSLSELDSRKLTPCDDGSQHLRGDRHSTGSRDDSDITRSASAICQNMLCPSNHAFYQGIWRGFLQDAMSRPLTVHSSSCQPARWRQRFPVPSRELSHGHVRDTRRQLFPMALCSRQMTRCSVGSRRLHDCNHFPDSRQGIDVARNASMRAAVFATRLTHSAFSSTSTQLARRWRTARGLPAERDSGDRSLSASAGVRQSAAVARPSD